MTRLELILDQTMRLSASEREQLLRPLSAQAFVEGADDERAVGKGGLAAWSESTQGDDWSMLYPDTLRSGGRQRS